MNDCVFCKIVCGEIPSQKLYEDDDLIVIRDIEPKAKLHYLCIPKEHFALLSEMDEGRAELVNQGENGGQTVLHLHIHILGGEPLTGF